MLWSLFCLLLLLPLFMGVPRRRFPLKPEPASRNTKPLKRLECRLGGNNYEIGTEWKPDLGASFGVRVCIKCRCAAISRKRRVIAKVRCANFADKCPKPNCANPVVRQDACCKFCPNSPSAVDVFEGPQHIYNWGPGYHEYMALLSGSGFNAAANGIGRAYLTLYRRNLHYSVYFEDLRESPITFRFIDRRDAIVYEDTLTSRGLITDKVCGVWDNIPRFYARALKRGDLRVAFSTQKYPNGCIGGPAMKFRRLKKESFSSILTPDLPLGPTKLGFGAAASIDLRIGRNALYINVVFSAKFTNASAPKTVFMQIEKDDGRHVTLTKTHPTSFKQKGVGTFLAIIEIRLDEFENRWFNQGRLRLIMTLPNSIPTQFSGHISSKRSCDMYQAVLSSLSPTPSNESYPAGIATIDVTFDNSFNLKVHMTGLNDSDVVSYEIDGELRRNRKELIANNKMAPDVIQGTIHDTFSQEITGRSIVLLYQQKLYVDISTAETKSVLRGRLRRVLYSVSVHPQTVPNLMVSNSGASGAVWFADPSITRPCQLHYTMAISGITPGSTTDLPIDLCELENRNICPHSLSNFQSVSKDVADFFVYGVADAISSSTWQQLNNGKLFVKVTQPSISTTVLVSNIQIPNRCSQMMFQRDRMVYEEQRLNEIEETTQCKSDDMRTFEEGQRWRSTRRNCTMCHCRPHGTVSCDPIPCPVVHCRTPVLSNDGCCSTCGQDSTSNKIGFAACKLGDHQYAHNSSWYPYVPPLGFSKCTPCSCNNGEVSCDRIQCPMLTCDKSLQYREESNDCCAKCKSGTFVSEKMPDEGKASCVFGGKRIRHRKRFNLYRVKCRGCVCLNGKIHCPPKMLCT